jgi:DNA-binding GntR family transcriptional regulator
MMNITAETASPAARPVDPLPPGLVVEPPAGPASTDIRLDADDGRNSLCQRAYAQIRKSLITSAIRPGHKLILRPLAAELHLSPTPVREALLRLVSEQALVLDERGSAIVPIMDQTSFRELSEMRGDLEARAAERAVEFATVQQIDELERINAECLDLHRANRHAAMLEANASFHRSVCKAAAAPLILRMLEGLWMRLGPVYALSFDRPLPEFGPDGHPHLQLIEALRQRDVALARGAAFNDVRYSNEILRPSLIDA